MNEKISLISLHSRCELEPNPGPYFAAISKYYYDKKEGKCKEFIWEDAEGLYRYTLDEYEDIWMSMKTVDVIGRI